MLVYKVLLHLISSANRTTTKMSDFLTPGVVFLARGSLSLVFPCALIAIVRYILDAHFDIQISILQIALAAATLGPATLVARYHYAQFNKRNRAAALGQRLAPKLTGGIGNVSRMMEMMEGMKNDMCGTCASF